MQTYPLRERDIIKFGKQKIKVREIVLNDHNPSAVADHIKTDKKVYEDLRQHHNARLGKEGLKEEPIAEVQSVVTENEATCRICL